MDNQKLHWYYFTFIDGNSFHGAPFGLNYKDRICEELLFETKKRIGCNERSPLISCSYLGWMTEREFYAKKKDCDKHGSTLH